MNLHSYIRARKEDGQSLTQAVQDLAQITGSGVRSVWRWVDGGKMPPHAVRLLMVWQECSPEQRSRWFGL
jgi:hypothetical protein